MFDIVIASRSEIGRRECNEDQVRSGRNGSARHAVLCDGAGGHRDGQEASRRAAGCIDALLADCDPHDGDSHDGRPHDGDPHDGHPHDARPHPAVAFTQSTLTQAVLQAHAEVQRGQHAAGGTDRMHATLVVLWIDSLQGRALWSHVGDSRLYLVREARLSLLTADDSVVRRMLDAGLLSPEQAEVHPHRHQLVAALGMQGDIDPHTLPEAVPVREGDAFLLCSDGWWEALDDDTVLSTLAAATTPDDWLAAMQRCIEALHNPRQDNFSAVAVWVARR